MSQYDAQDARIAAIVGDEEELDLDECVEKFYSHLKKSLQLPCDVMGIEDFRWEEYFLLGPGDPKEYARLRQTRPSYNDAYELLAVKNDVSSEWMLFPDEDLAGLVRRKSDGMEFDLGLSELRAVDKKSKNFQLLDDFTCWLHNSR